ncbi:hypothetical protein [Methanosarcina barkeri]|uniref:hypothetical protein n=1 Tax=Methanosarcina barkeri TaxID=2208 RepID=UPI00003C6830|nr:hypothetical protein [Methanosarcina barkeri]
MRRDKIHCSNKYELCENCRVTFVPVTKPLINGKRLCSSCAGTEIQIRHLPNIRNQNIKLSQEAV